jgi:hypothetical protein
MNAIEIANKQKGGFDNSVEGNSKRTVMAMRALLTNNFEKWPW